MAFKVRTDLALEAKENIQDEEGALRGVSVEEYDVEGKDIHVSRVHILTPNGEKALGKPIGVYITLEAPAMTEPDEEYHREISEEFAHQLFTLLPDMSESRSILVAGLGNREVTADSLGPRVADNLLITRHLILEYGQKACVRERVHKISAVVPGVMAMTGMEAAEMLRGIVAQTRPDAVIVVDALAARSIRRLNRTIQISNTGIHPGGGVGNHRSAVTSESIGAPLVIAVGIPTVVDAGTIVNDAFAKWKKEKNIRLEEMPEPMPELSNFYVAGKDIDEIVKRLSFTVSEGINLALSMFREW